MCVADDKIINTSNIQRQPAQNCCSKYFHISRATRRRQHSVTCCVGCWSSFSAQKSTKQRESRSSRFFGTRWSMSLQRRMLEAAGHQLIGKTGEMPIVIGRRHRYKVVKKEFNVGSKREIPFEFFVHFWSTVEKKGWRRGALLSIHGQVCGRHSVVHSVKLRPFPHFVAGSQWDGRHVICQGNVQSCALPRGLRVGLATFFFPVKLGHIPINWITTTSLIFSLLYQGNRVDTESTEFLVDP